MKKTILTFALMLMMALATVAAPAINTHRSSKPAVAMRGDSALASGVREMEKVRDKIDATLDDTITRGDGSYVSIGNQELSPEDIRAMSDQWASVVKQMMISGSFCLLGLVTLVLLFRFLNRRNKYRVIEKAIENNYPLNELSLNDVKRSAIYVQQPVVQAPPVIQTPPAVSAAPAQQSGGVPVGTPMPGQAAASPIVMTDMVNWRALMPAVKWIGWGTLLVLFSAAIGDFENPFWPIGLALTVVGVCKGFILYKEQKTLQQAWKRAEQMQPREPMREGIPVPPAFDNDYKGDDDANYQP